MSKRWFKNSIIYSVDVETFQDSDGDGVGDFPGLTSRLDYLEAMGVTCVWLLPFYPTPNRDNGYDVMDYYGVDPRLGSLGDFVEFVQEAGERGLRVIIDLVLNHTSIEHPWFQAARRGDPKYHDFYVWREDEPPDTSDQAIFPPEQEGIWTFDEEAKAWYMHRFYKWQPDLNITNPAVQREMERIMQFWLQLGVSGFRIDAAPFLVELRGTSDSTDSNDFDYGFISDFREFLSWHRGDAVLLAEANVAPDKISEYFGDGDRMHMLFNFLTNQEIYLSLARESAKPLRKSFADLPAKPESSQWAYFLRNHDELSLDKLTEKERQECFKAFGPEEKMQLFGRGIRRRLAPMLEGDEARLRLAYSLLFTMPGAVVLWYGEEIGMGDDLSLEGRDAVRTPMQWNKQDNGGFSKAPEKDLVRQVVSKGPFGYKKVNAEALQRDPNSLLQFITRMAQVRKESPEFSTGEFKVLKTNAEADVFAHACVTEGHCVAAVHNFTGKKVSVKVDFKDLACSQVMDILGGSADHKVQKGSCSIDLEPYGLRWLRLRE